MLLHSVFIQRLMATKMAVPDILLNAFLEDISSVSLPAVRKAYVLDSEICQVAITNYHGHNQNKQQVI
jgi:hypothetical protein